MKIIMCLTVLPLFLLLASCSAEDEAATEAAVSAESGSFNLKILEENLEDITPEEWDSLQLSKADFNHFLKSLKETPSKTMQELADVEIADETIHVTINNTEGNSLDNVIAAPFIDTWIRQAFIHSDYFDDQQPVIRISDLSGELIAEQSDSLTVIE